jgi:hypothetical protein
MCGGRIWPSKRALLLSIIKSIYEKANRKRLKDVPKIRTTIAGLFAAGAMPTNV